jgi:hypothetical protein
MKRHFGGLAKNLDIYVKETTDVESTKLYKKLIKVKLLSDLHVLVKENKLEKIRNINATFTTGLDDYEYKSKNTGPLTQMRALTISFDYKNYHIECVEHMWYYAKVDTPNIFDQPHGVSSCQNYENYCYIHFYDLLEWNDTDKSDKDELNDVEKPNIVQEDLKALFDFIHLASLKICNYDPFEMVFPCSYEEKEPTAYQSLLTRINAKKY